MTLALSLVCLFLFPPLSLSLPPLPSPSLWQRRFPSIDPPDHTTASWSPLRLHAPRPPRWPHEPAALRKLKRLPRDSVRGDGAHDDHDDGHVRSSWPAGAPTPRTECREMYDRTIIVVKLVHHEAVNCLGWTHHCRPFFHAVCPYGYLFAQSRSWSFSSFMVCWEEERDHVRGLEWQRIVSGKDYAVIFRTVQNCSTLHAVKVYTKLYRQENVTILPYLPAYSFYLKAEHVKIVGRWMDFTFQVLAMWIPCDATTFYSREQDLFMNFG